MPYRYLEKIATGDAAFEAEVEPSKNSLERQRGSSENLNPYK
jgi:hypothetical protein